MFCEPFWVGRNILLVGGFTLVLRPIFYGTARLVSKLCFYCLLLSILWGFEPYYAPPGSDAMSADYGGGSSEDGVGSDSCEKKKKSVPAGVSVGVGRGGVAASPEKR